MVHADERHVARPRKPLGESQANHQGTHQAGRIGYRHGAQVVPGKVRVARALARLRQALDGNPADGLDMLSAGNLGHHAAEARMEVDLRGNHVGDDGARLIDKGAGGFIARRFDGQDELALNLDLTFCGVGALSRIVQAKLHTRNIVLRQGQRTFEDKGVFLVGIVARALADALQPQPLVEHMGARVGRTNFQRHPAGAQIARIKGDASQQLLSDSPAAIFRAARHFQQLHLAVVYPAAGVANQLGLAHVHRALARVGNLVSRPPGAIGARELVEHLRLVPGIGAHRLRLERGNRGHPRCLERLVADGGTALHARVQILRLGHGVLPILLGELDALVLFRIRQARVHRKQRTGVAQGKVVGIERAFCPCGLCRQQ